MNFTPRSCIKILDTVVFGIPRSASSSHICWSVAGLCWLRPVHVQHFQVFCLFQAFQNVDHFQQILNHLWNICTTFTCTALIVSPPKAFWIIWIVSVEECSNLMQIWCKFTALLTQSFWMQEPHSTASTAPLSPQLVQRSRHCSCMHIPVPSPWLPGYVDVVQTVFVMLTMAGLFPERPRRRILQ